MNSFRCCIECSSDFCFNCNPAQPYEKPFHWFTAFPPQFNIPQAAFWVRVKGLRPSDRKEVQSRFSFCAYRSYDNLCAVLNSPGVFRLETAHPYRNNADDVYAIPLDPMFSESTGGMTRLCVAFDERSATERNYDYLSFTNVDPTTNAPDGEELLQLGENLSGPALELPSFASPLTITHSGPIATLYGRFRSDGSNTGIECLYVIVISYFLLRYYCAVT